MIWRLINCMKMSACLLFYLLPFDSLSPHEFFKLRRTCHGSGEGICKQKLTTQFHLEWTEKRKPPSCLVRKVCFSTSLPQICGGKLEPTCCSATFDRVSGQLRTGCGPEAMGARGATSPSYVRLSAAGVTPRDLSAAIATVPGLYTWLIAAAQQPSM